MTWTLSGVEVKKHANPALARVLRTVRFTYNNLDANGVASGEPHTYTEDNVSDVTPTGLSRLARDQMAQLERISATSEGKLSSDDLAGLKTLMRHPALPAHVVASIANVVDFTQSDEQIVDTLNAVEQAHPLEVAPKLNRPMSLAAILGTLSVASKANVSSALNLVALESTVARGDNASTLAVLDVLHSAGDILDNEYEAAAALVEPIDDPAWSAQTSHAALILGRAATPADVAVARALT